MNFIHTLSESFKNVETCPSSRTEMAVEAETPSQSRIQSRWPVYEADEIAAVVDILQSGQVNSLHHGDYCRAFEKAFATLCEAPHAISVANGTLGLELALRALEIGPGDEVIVTPRSFIASASCIINCGAIPVFADVDLHSQNITAESVQAVLTDRSRAIIAVHLAGYPCDMDDLTELAAQNDLKIIEDCAQAHGATYKGRPIGSFGDASVFSFCTDKIISTGGEGGMLVVKCRDVWHRAWSYKDHGKDYDLTMQKVPGSAFRWIHTTIGSNYRMTEMQAAIGLLQLGKLDHWHTERNYRANILIQQLEGLKALRLPKPNNTVGHAFYKFYAFLNLDKLKQDWTRDRIIHEATSMGIPCQSGTCPEIYHEEAFSHHVQQHELLPNAHQLGLSSLLLPVDPTLTIREVNRMGQTLKNIVLSATL